MSKSIDQVAFEAYADEIDGLSVGGEFIPIPPWDEVPAHVRKGWEAATDAVAVELVGAKRSKSVFAFEIGERVTIRESGENGEIRGRVEYVDATPSYYVHYLSADGRAVTAWWVEGLLDRVDVTQPGG